MHAANHYTSSSRGYNENQRVVDEEPGEKEIDSINVSSD